MTIFHRSAATALLLTLLVSMSDCKKLIELGTQPSSEIEPPQTAPATSVTTSSTTSPSKGSSAETPCWMLTPAEVASVLKLQTVAIKLPKAGEYGAPRCQWAPPTEASNPPSIVIAYFGDQGKDVDKFFEDHLETDTKIFKAFHEPIAGLGDKAMLFGARLWVKKGDAFFSLTFSGVDWSAAQITPRDAQLKLAKLALAHMR
jgi:hypothetical protein